jgi:predicted GIY-YIG superfamily endonuclease
MIQKMHYLYILEIAMGQKRWLGYGITNDPDRRELEHQQSLSEAGFTTEPMTAFAMSSKEIASECESFIKKNTLQENIKVDGFRTECAPIEQKRYIEQIIKRYASANTEPGIDVAQLDAMAEAVFANNRCLIKSIETDLLALEALSAKMLATGNAAT